MGHGGQGTTRGGGGRGSQGGKREGAALLEHAGSIGSSGKGRKEGSAGRGGEGEEALAGGSTTAGQHHDGDDDDELLLLLLRISKTLVCLRCVMWCFVSGVAVLQEQREAMMMQATDRHSIS